MEKPVKLFCVYCDKRLESNHEMCCHEVGAVKFARAFTAKRSLSDEKQFVAFITFSDGTSQEKHGTVAEMGGWFDYWF